SHKDLPAAFDKELQTANECTHMLPESNDDLRAESNLLKALENAGGTVGKGPQNMATAKAASIALAKLKDLHWDECKAKKDRGTLDCTYGKNVNHRSVVQLEWMIEQHKAAMDKKYTPLP
ncbi:hypothetical protein HDU81_011431, partial [Chytriomyces hyalinus]